VHPQPPRRTTHAYGTPKNLLVHDRWGCYGRPVVLLHGLNYDRTMWWPVGAEIGNGFTAVAVDLPGHGQSAARDSDGMELLAHDLAMLVHRLDLRRAPIVVGHGESARLAASFADRYVTHAVITVGAAQPDPRLDGVPEEYRQFAVARPDPALLEAYRGWHAAPAGPPSRCVHLGEGHFPHLRDPAGFAALLSTAG
jgi:pimeloyl-ACP methyl ester carboxylesterase